MIRDNLPDNYIEDKVQEICKNIGKEGTQTSHYDVFRFIYDYVEDNLYKYLPEPVDVEFDY